VKKIKKEEKCF